MKTRKAPRKVLRHPVKLGDAAKLLGVRLKVVQELVSSMDLLTIEVRGARLIPPCELRRFRPPR